MVPRILVAISLALAAAASLAQNYPARPVHLIVPYPPGGTSDNVSRIVADRLATLLGQPVVVENRGGAAGTIAVQAAQAAKPDGYTLLMGPTAIFAITPHLRAVPYDPVNGFDAVAMLATSPSIAAVYKDHPARTMAEFIAAAKKQPGKMTFGSAGPGSITHLYGEVLKQRAGIDMLHVPFKGSADSMTALLGRQIDIIIDPVALGQVRGGALRALAIFGDQRIAELPDVPTIAEVGYQVDLPSWFGLFTPKGTPPAVVARVSGEVAKLLREPETQARLQKMNLVAAYKDPAAFAQQVREDSRTIGDFIRSAGIKGD